MKIIKPSYEILTPLCGEDILKQIERIGRVCYKSEDKITPESAVKFVATLIKNGHEAMVEHGATISVKFICDRGVSHELVRHRLCSWAQESTRYCNYSIDKFDNGPTFIEPCFWEKESYQYLTWKECMSLAEDYYLCLIEKGSTPQEARSVLPNSLKTEIVMTANLREWRAFFKLRVANIAHPQMRELTRPLLLEFQQLIPIVFDDIKF
jgi:thymidylate synthase (FAD)